MWLYIFEYNSKRKQIVNKLLCENFADVINVEFTAKVETEFDNIAEGQEDWKKMIGEFYGPFEENVERVEKELEHVELVDEVSDIPCDKCGRMMVYNMGDLENSWHVLDNQNVKIQNQLLKQ